MLKAENSCLVIIDIQGKLASLMQNKEDFYANVVRMIRAAQVLNMPIIWNEQIPEKLGTTIDQIKEAISQDAPLAKTTFSCCGNADFVKTLDITKRKDILLVGMETHVCVYQTAIDLINSKYNVHIVADAVSSRIIENKTIGLNGMKEAGAKITSVEMCLFEMLGKAEGDQFKQIIKIVK
jgi:nicotinamidase-related amidase